MFVDLVSDDEKVWMPKHHVRDFLQLLLRKNRASRIAWRRKNYGLRFFCDRVLELSSGHLKIIFNCAFYHYRHAFSKAYQRIITDPIRRKYNYFVTGIDQCQHS